MSIRLSALLTLAGFTLASPAPGIVVTLQEGVNGVVMNGVRIRSDAAGTQQANKSDTVWIAGTTGTGLIRTPVGFDLSSIPAGSTITAVSFSLTQVADGTSTSTSQTLHLQPLTTAFVETAVTWNSPWTTPGGDFSSTICSSVTANPQVSTGAGGFTFASTAEFVTAAQTALDGGGVLRFMLVGDSALEASPTRNLFTFRPDEYTTVAERPRLDIEYAPVPEPALLAFWAGLAAVAGLVAVRRR